MTALDALGRDYAINFNSPAARATLEKEGEPMAPIFELPQGTRLRIANVNVRSETHGDDHVPGLDVAVRTTMSNDALAMLYPKLKQALYEKQRAGAAAANDDEEQRELQLPVSDLPSLRFPDLAPQRSSRKFEGYTFVVETVGRQVTIPDCKVNTIVFECIEGGSVVLTFRVQAAAGSVDADTYGTLGMAMALCQDVTGALTPPAAAAQQEQAA